MATDLGEAALSTYVDDALVRVAALGSSDGLSALRAELTGKRSALNGWHRQLGALGEEERRSLGRLLNDADRVINAAFDARGIQLAADERRDRLTADRLCLDELVDRPVDAPLGRGRRHLVTQTRDELEDVFVAMGFQVVEGPEIETDWYNFEALNLPLGHPARGMHDTMYLDVGTSESVVLRTHTSPVQVRSMEAAVRDRTLPLHLVAPGRVYRRDTPDASHLVEFNQIEGLVVDEGITFADLAGTISAFTSAYFGDDIVARLRPSYFPFTEPSAEFDITCTICKGARCRTCGQTGWMELGGCGVIDPAVFAAVGIHPARWSGFAFGFGIDRCAFMRHQVADLRALVDNDVRFLRQF